MTPIRKLQKGSGEYAVWYRVGQNCSKIKEELKDIRFGKDATYSIVVYRVYAEDEMIAEIESGGGSVMLQFGTVEPSKTK